MKIFCISTNGQWLRFLAEQLREMGHSVDLSRQLPAAFRERLSCDLVFFDPRTPIGADALLPEGTLWEEKLWSEIVRQMSRENRVVVTFFSEPTFANCRRALLSGALYCLEMPNNIVRLQSDLEEVFELLAERQRESETLRNLRKAAMMSAQPTIADPPGPIC